MRSEYKSNRNTLMKKEKELYTAPALRLLDLNIEGAFCASTDPVFVNPFSGGEEEWD